MLRNTFCHIPGIGPRSEQKLWDRGITCWDSIYQPSMRGELGSKTELLQQEIRKSAIQLAAGNAEYFDQLLPSNQSWRMFPEFQDSVAYLDIETTGLDADIDYITTMALFDGTDIYYYVRGQNMAEFAQQIAKYRLIVTYNGKTFDVPFIRKHLHAPMRQAHIDLRYVLASCGLTGGLKQCEKNLGMDRHDLTDVDGDFAVLLWREYIDHKDQRALETLLAYNITDVVNLASIMPLAYNMKIQDTPFHQSKPLPLPSPVELPFSADFHTIQRIRQKYWL